jgi:hypothetical protein
VVYCWVKHHYAVCDYANFQFPTVRAYQLMLRSNLLVLYCPFINKNYWCLKIKIKNAVFQPILKDKMKPGVYIWSGSHIQSWAWIEVLQSFYCKFKPHFSLSFFFFEWVKCWYEYCYWPRQFYLHIIKLKQRHTTSKIYSFPSIKTLQLF